MNGTQTHMTNRVKFIRADTFAYLPTMADASVDCVVTSPPYWGLKDYNGRANLFGNEPTLDDYLAKCRTLFRELRRIVKDKGSMWINVGYKRDSDGGLILLPALVAQAAKDEGLYLRDHIIWHKRGHCAPDSSKNRHRNAHEVVLHLTKIKSGYYHDEKASRLPYKSPLQANAKSQHRKVYTAVARGFLAYAESIKAHAEIDRRTKAGLNNRVRLRDGKVMHANGAKCGPDSRARALARDGFVFDNWNESGAVGENVWVIGGTTRGFDHPCSFPIELPTRCIRIGCPKNGIVFDPFMGSGSTAVAAMRLNRRCIGIEFMPEHIETAKRRVQDGT